jgi:mono/diheme cytochrome c family protein
MPAFFRWLIALVLVGAATGWFLTRPQTLDAASLAGLTGDATAGETVFNAAGCASCHAAPGAEGEDRLVLSGGYRMKSPFGTFVAPNISPSSAGIGGWSTLSFANAVLRGVSPDGAHYYPSFPYGSYARMTLEDVVDLKAFMDTLPPSDTASAPHELSFPFSIRRSVGGWKLLFADDDWVMPAGTAQLERGRYLVEALGHCAECHTPRNALGGLDTSRWMQGAPNPSGQGRILAINSTNLSWSAGDIAYYLESGFTPDFDSAGGNMTDVIANMSKLSAEDREAIAAYVKSVP